MPVPRLRLPVSSPGGIEKGADLSQLLGAEAIDCLAHNLRAVYPAFRATAFRKSANSIVQGEGIMRRGRLLGALLGEYLPSHFKEATDILIASLTPPIKPDDGTGLGGFFYLPHGFFVAERGLHKQPGGPKPFPHAMRALREITRRFTSEFAIRPFLVHHTEKTLEQLLDWTADTDENVRRLCSEGSRPRLPWGERLPAFVKDPQPVLPILERLKDDPSAYVRRSVANHLGDIGKDHPELLLSICQAWLKGAGEERRALIRHALRYPANHGNQAALSLRIAAGHRPSSPRS